MIYQDFKTIRTIERPNVDIRLPSKSYIYITRSIIQFKIKAIEVLFKIHLFTLVMLRCF